MKSESPYWFVRHSKSIIFLILTLAFVGGYLAFTIPVAVFPSTNFPRVIIGVDNGVMPIDQMMVTITRPLEEAVNSVQGLQTVQSITSRGSAEIDLYFNWNVDMFETLQRVNSAVADGAELLAAHGADRNASPDVCEFSHHWLQPYFGHDAADRPLGNGNL